MTAKNSIFTEFASAERESSEQVQERFYELIKIPELKTFLDAIPDIFVVLNDKRQIVYANSRLLETLGLESVDQVLGKRLGEALNCQYSQKLPCGCGTSLFCSQCSAVKAMLESLEGKFSVHDCHILNVDYHAFDFRVWATPYEYKGNKYSLYAIRDISNEKRRQSLEQIFFHDILNTLNGLLGFSQVLKEDPEKVYELKDIIYEISNLLWDEINAQKMLLSAEEGTLRLSIAPVNTLEIINSVKNIFLNNLIAKGREIIIDSNSVNETFATDKTLLKRVIINLVKNATEAINKDEKVTIGVNKEEDHLIFWVHNPGVIPLEYQLQLFLRSFSTKGAGRGLGTYSVKLLCEKYLKGKVSFASNESEGTKFFIKLNMFEFPLP